MTANITQRHHVTTTHGWEMVKRTDGGRGGRKDSFVLNERLFSHLSYFCLILFTCVHNSPPRTIILAQRWLGGINRKRWCGGIFSFPFHRAGRPSTRPRQGDGVSNAESAGRKLCNLSHKHTQINGVQRGRVEREKTRGIGRFFTKTLFKKRKQRPKEVLQLWSLLI